MAFTSFLALVPQHVTSGRYTLLLNGTLFTYLSLLLSRYPVLTFVAQA